MAGGTDKAAAEASGVVEAATALKPTNAQRKRRTSSSGTQNSDNKKRGKRRSSRRPLQHQIDNRRTMGAQKRKEKRIQ